VSGIGEDRMVVDNLLYSVCVGGLWEGLPSCKGGLGYYPLKFFEFTDAKSCILAHFDIKNYLLQTPQCSRKKNDLLQSSSSDHSLKLSQKLRRIEAHPPHTKIIGRIYPCILWNRRRVQLPSGYS
jgi:hypothetical protein